MQSSSAIFPSAPRIAIVGAGAVGGYYGARLAQHGHDVHFLLRGDYDAVQRSGWDVKSIAGDFRIAPGETHVYDSPRKMAPADLVIVTLKTTSNDRYEPLIRPLLKDSTAILTLQNGLGNEDRLASLFGAERVLGGIAFVCINRIGPGKIHHIDHGTIQLGEFRGGASTRAQAIARIFNDSKVPCDVLENVIAGRWTKLVWNVPFSGLGAVLDVTTDQLLASDAGVQLVSVLMEEVVAAARGLGYPMPDDLVEVNLARTRTMGAYQSSMQIDRREGRAMEIESILGEPLRQARGAGLAIPKLEMLCELARVVNSSSRGTAAVH
jgi:2-dehydropantoate 2-reductase